ncbi:hypothetical protein [Terrisporobacter sp.]|uniref:hypothetical protein n=1 Tax=Terrisporobacter sp. TaxID=1965305 RepID=UPI00261104AF|nr:hypothetical protein [Terrisporobacter sp.]
MNYQLELRNILDKIYDYKIYNILLKKDIDKLNENNIDHIKSLLINEEIYLGSDMHDFIINLISEGFEGYNFRKTISIVHNITYPLLYDENGNTLKNYTFTNFAKKLWEENTHELLITDLYSMFSQEDFIKYINDNMNKICSDILIKVKDFKNNKNITIPFKDISKLSNSFKKSILDGKLDFSYAISYIDMDLLRDDMMKNVVDLDFYDEFDKLEDDLEECLEKFFKYNNEELLNTLVNKDGFELVEGIGLVKNK